MTVAELKSKIDNLPGGAEVVVFTDPLAKDTVECSNGICKLTLNDDGWEQDLFDDDFEEQFDPYDELIEDDFEEADDVSANLGDDIDIAI